MAFKWPLKFHVKTEVDTSLEKKMLKMGWSSYIVFV